MRAKFCRAAWVGALVLSTAGVQWAGNESPTGRWKTIDDQSGQARGIVRLYEENGAIFGKIESAFKASEAKEHCNLCKDERKGQPVIGMVVLRGLRKQGDEYTGGDILDPDTGIVYRCKLRLLDGGKRLLVRGYVLVPVLGRSQIWIREPEGAAADLQRGGR